MKSLFKHSTKKPSHVLHVFYPLTLPSHVINGLQFYYSKH